MFVLHRNSTGPLALFMLALICIPKFSARAADNSDAGLNNLVILDPGKHERGLPAVEVKPSPNGLQVEVPPTVHVHRYYYSGDKIYQGPIIQGGPIVIVAKHPKTGVQMNVNAVLPPGAPRIAYTRNSITYVYPDQRVEVKFRHFPFDPGT